MQWLQSTEQEVGSRDGFQKIWSTDDALTRYMGGTGVEVNLCREKELKQRTLRSGRGWYIQKTAVSLGFTKHTVQEAVSGKVRS